MQVSVEKVSNIERRLTISIPAEKVEEAYKNQINHYAKKADMKGFRPGKAPISVIEQRFGQQARGDALSAVIQDALIAALKEHHLNPVNTPQVEPKSLLANQPLEFVATFEVLPEIEKVEFSADAVEKLKVDVTPEDIELVLQQLKKQFTQWKAVDRAAQMNDQVVIDYYAVFNGEADTNNKVQDYPLELGSKRALPGFEEGLIGAKAGEEKTLALTFPSDFSVEEKAGKPIDFVVQVKQIFEAEIPGMDENFVKKLGVASGKEEDLKGQIKQSLEQERDRLVKEKLKEQIFSKLLEQNPIEVPNSLIAREAQAIHDEVYPKDKPHDHEKHTEAETAQFNDVAKKRIALSLLINHYAKQGDLKADKERVEQRIQEIASAYEHPREVVDWLHTRERLNGIEAQILEEQVLEKLVEGIQVNEKTMSYADLKGIRL